MGIFDFFKKEEEPSYDATNIQVTDLNVGFVFEYDLSTWEVKAVYRYDWGNEHFSREFKVSNGVDTRYLSLEDDDEIELEWSKKVKISKIDIDLLDTPITEQKPPRKIHYEGTAYRLANSSMGYFFDEGTDEDWAEFRTWNFESAQEETLTIEQWDDEEFDASVGKVIKEFEISNILPV